MKNYKVNINNEDKLYSEFIKLVLNSPKEGGITIREMYVALMISDKVSDIEEKGEINLDQDEWKFVFSVLMSLRFNMIEPSLIDFSKEIKKIIEE